MRADWEWTLDPLRTAQFTTLFAIGVFILIWGIISERDPKSVLRHLFPVEYLAPCLLAACLVPISFSLYLAIRLGGKSYLGFSFQEGTSAQRMLTADAFAAFFALVACVSTVIVFIQSIEFFRNRHSHRGEFCSLLILATFAICLAAASTDLIMIYLSLEMLSLISYALAAFLKTDHRSSEAGIKYFLFGSVCSAIMVYGMSIIVGIVGSTSLFDVSRMMNIGVMGMPLMWIGIFMFLAGIGFKLALVPFHLWAPDTYEGAPTPITSFLSAASKAAGIAVVCRVLFTVIPLLGVGIWFAPVAVLCGLSMTIGNLAAIWQTNIKRMMAYSSIAQMGYMTIGFLAFGWITAKYHFYQPTWGFQGLLIYLAAYVLMNLGTFAIIIHLAERTGSDKISSFSGMVRRAPFLSGVLAFFFLSLAGIPPTAGFIAKFYVFGAAIQAGSPEHPTLWWLAALGVANSVISVYYYFNVARVMFFDRSEDDSPIDSSWATNFGVGLTAALTFLLGIFPQPLITLTDLTVKSLGWF